MSREARKAGYISIVGRPNVGKSTLLNTLLEQRISITSKKRQTTRHNIIGIKTEKNAQLIFVDTPGIHKGEDNAMNRYMNRVACSALDDVDIIIFVVDRDTWNAEDDAVMQRLREVSHPIIIALNKTDELASVDHLLPHAAKLASLLPKADVVPISALRGDNLDALQSLLIGKLPEADAFIYPEDQVTDRSVRFLASEIIREKIVRLTGAELPYQTTVEIEEFKEEPSLVRINALILTEREGQKRIIVGEKGERIKQIGIDARGDIEALVSCKVMLTLWVKVKTGWSDDDRALRSLGFDD